MNKILIPKGKRIERERTVAVACRISESIFKKYEEIFSKTYLTPSQVYRAILENALDDVEVADK